MSTTKPRKEPAQQDPAGRGNSEETQWIRDAVRDHEGPLLRYACRIVGDLERAREIVQECFLKLCSQDPLQVRDHLTEWLFTVCRNRALDVQRKEKRMSPIGDQDLPVTASEAPGPLQALEQKEKESKVLGALRSLSWNQQEVIRLKFQSGLSYREISRVTNLTVSNVGFLIHTGLKTLRKRLAETRATGSVQ